MSVSDFAKLFLTIDDTNSLGYIVNGKVFTIGFSSIHYN